MLANITNQKIWLSRDWATNAWLPFVTNGTFLTVIKNGNNLFLSI